jgi:hypothetical protein
LSWFAKNTYVLLAIGENNEPVASDMGLANFDMSTLGSLMRSGALSPKL